MWYIEDVDGGSCNVVHMPSFSEMSLLGIWRLQTGNSSAAPCVDRYEYHSIWIYFKGLPIDEENDIIEPTLEAANIIR